ncbi:GntR family transcriptional regulator [Dactylosporangium sucinum]|uniref:GntR family transcriptional regulator n=1 Tax=Dactylosporangium sucinum TaxID=1424081 RepID=A0A917U2M4_9ACTN|nr:GntR family transcriptional regulator [Dactylosporangium sucinum]
MTPGRSASYRRIVDDLRRIIESGELGEGSKLPGVREIATRYGVPTGTVSRAIAELAAAGLVQAKRRGGTYVRRFAAIPRSSPGRLAKERWLGGETIQDADTKDRRRELNTSTGETPAPDWVAAALGVAAGEPVAFRDRRYAVDERFVQLATSYLPVDIARGTQIMHTDTGPGGTYARLAEIGHRPVRFTEYLRARMPSPEETDRLELPVGTPVFEITRHAFNEEGRCVEINRMILDGMAYLLDYSFPA